MDAGAPSRASRAPPLFWPWGCWSLGRTGAAARRAPPPRAAGAWCRIAAQACQIVSCAWFEAMVGWDGLRDERPSDFQHALFSRQRSGSEYGCVWSCGVCRARGRGCVECGVWKWMCVFKCSLGVCVRCVCAVCVLIMCGLCTGVQRCIVVFVEYHRIYIGTQRGVTRSHRLTSVLFTPGKRSLGSRIRSVEA